MKKFLFIVLLILMLIPSISLAQQGSDGGIIEDKSTILKAQVLKIISEETLDIGDRLKTVNQKISVRILEEDRLGEEIELSNDYTKLKEGEKFYLLEIVRWETGEKLYTVHDKYRIPAIIFFVVLFLVSLLAFGGMQGIRGLVSLIGSIVLIMFILMPGILNGYSPIFVTIGVSSLIIILGSYITHGFNKTTSSAVIGMIATVLVTGILAFFAVKWAGLSGFESEEAVYLNWNTRGSIDFVGLLLGGIIIGLLGVLYDVAIGQAIAVEELRDASKDMDKKTILKRALRIGKEHTGALVNTLAIAYVGASLPLLLLFYSDTSSTLIEIINREVFATEIIRTMVGSIGLVLAVPITSLISVWMLIEKDK